MKKQIKMRLAPEAFGMVYKGEKTVEVRLNDEKRRDLKAGDEIIFCRSDCEAERVVATVKSLRKFKTFKELFSSGLTAAAGFEKLSAAEAAEKMRGYYTEEQEKRYGVLAIEISAEDNLNIIYGIIKDEYADCGVAAEYAFGLAEEIYGAVFKDGENLNAVLSYVYEFEECMRLKGVKIGCGRQCVIFDGVVRLLDINANNAKRLYESFEWYRDVLVFDLLMNEYEEFLTKEQRENLLETARETFVPEVWESYV